MVIAVAVKHVVEETYAAGRAIGDRSIGVGGAV
jgi:hypothetical protein